MVSVDVFLMVSDSDDEHICFVLTTRKVTLTKQRGSHYVIASGKCLRSARGNSRWWWWWCSTPAGRRSFLVMPVLW
jgi:hypothetical protein